MAWPPVACDYSLIRFKYSGRLAPQGSLHVQLSPATCSRRRAMPLSRKVPRRPRGPLESTQGDLAPQWFPPLCIGASQGSLVWDLRAYPPGPGGTQPQRACDTNPVTVQGPEQLVLVHEGGGAGATIRSNPVSHGTGRTLSPRTAASRRSHAFCLLHCPRQPTSAPDFTPPLPSHG